MNQLENTFSHPQGMISDRFMINRTDVTYVGTYTRCIIGVFNLSIDDTASQIILNQHAGRSSVGRALNMKPRDRGFEPQQHQSLVSPSHKTMVPSWVGSDN